MCIRMSFVLGSLLSNSLPRAHKTETHSALKCQSALVSQPCLHSVVRSPTHAL